MLLVDHRPLDEPGQLSPGECSGGLPAPAAQAMLSRLGLELPKNVLEEPQLLVVGASAVPRRLERRYHGHYINMDRLRSE